MNKAGILLVTLFSILACQTPSATEKVKNEIVEMLKSEKGVFAVAFKDLESGDVILINEHENFHAASTMKTPVMIEVFKQAAEGKFSMKDSILVKNEFASIVDQSPYTLHADEDSEQELYGWVGRKKTLYDLVYSMIIRSSNLATNIVIDKVDAKAVTTTMRSLGANDIQVLRGVEDSKAYEKGLSNTTTAFDMMVIFEKLARKEIVSTTACDSMISILSDQEFNEIIPKYLPENVKVAHKTGFITGVHHDTGIVILPDGHAYVLVLLSKEMEDFSAGTAMMARISKRIYEMVMHKPVAEQ